MSGREAAATGSDAGTGETYPRTVDADPRTAEADPPTAEADPRAAEADPRAEELRRVHGARARSAYGRAVAACRHAGVGQDAAEIVPKDSAGRAANALRLSAGSLAALADGAPDPAADARCARNTAATAALAAQLAAARDGGPAAAEALRAALWASRTAAAAAGGLAPGRDAALNATAEEAERRAVATAREAGWPA
ncbi:hypothetical protein [Streptomyces naphthomycinicus]|uniref:hypothetical protein n=1 Tax=Streptomyces naphthomycinicus TaxID=2872625 RepID=UPI001CED8471|nr:hypothetical protein [Streptomyces sp. TML10]